VKQSRRFSASRSLLAPPAVLAAASAFVLAGAHPAFAQGYGNAVAVDGSEIFVGEGLNDRTPGYVYVYRNNAGAWEEAQRLEASDAQSADHFGRSLAVADGDLLVGATVAGATNSDATAGAVYVFRKDDAGQWTEVQRIAASDAVPGDAWGRVMTAGGSHVFASTWGHADGRGAVYVLAKQDDGRWTQSAKLMAGDGAANDRFGQSLASDGDWALVGAPAANQQRGVVYVFRRDDDGAWNETQKLELENLAQPGPDSSEPAPRLAFGASVVVGHGMALVGAPMANEMIGSVYGFALDEEAGLWRQETLHGPFDAHPFTRFGVTIAPAPFGAWIGATSGTYVLSWDEELDGWGSLAKFAGVGGGSVAALGETFGVLGLQGDDFGAGTATIVEHGADGWAVAAEVASEVVGLDAIAGEDVVCEDGRAGEFPCTDVDIVSFLPVSDIGGGRGVEVNDVWGWTDPETGTEWALVGRYDGTSFIDLSDPANPVYAGTLPLTEGARPNVWRDIKVYADHAFVVSDGAGKHGMQVFDLAQLREPRDGPVVFEATARYDGIHSAHNIVINEETGFAYAVGSSGGGDTCGGGLHMIDIRNPTAPEFAGCFADATTGRRRTGYSHDAMCINYRGPDEEHRDKEICFGSNETALSIADVSDKDAPVALASASYPNFGYSHQGWIDEQHEYFYMNDELDELGGSVDATRTLVWDVKDLDDPLLVKEHFSENKSSDHNLYVLGDFMYQSNYVSGLRILDISDRENPEEVAFFDTVPWTEDAPGFDGSWSNYPYFKSGIIVVTSGKEGVFVLRKAQRNLIP